MSDPDPAQRAEALESLLRARGLVDASAIDAVIDLPWTRKR